MKVFAAVLAISIASIASAAPSRAQSAPTIIQGTVDNPERNPIPGVSVYAHTQGGTFQTTTDRNGHFSFWNINSGDVFVTFSGFGYDSQTGILCVQPGAIRTLHLTLNRHGGSVHILLGRPDMVDAMDATTFVNCVEAKGYGMPYPIGTLQL